MKRSLIIWAAKAIILLASRVWAYLGKSFGHIKEAFISFFRLACRDRLAAMTAAALTLYTFAAVILGMLLLAFIDSAGATLFVFVLVIAMFATAMYRLVKGFGAFDKIKEGIFKIRAGDISYKITDVGTGVSGDIAEAVNNIGDGLAESVKTKIRAERMKAELITNVSHDLKTPLTSIINYTDLLAGMELEPNEANDYVKILKSKGERLKNLTRDLFDISKAQSGNEQVNLERIDISLLMRQALGESDELVKSSGLEFITDLEDGMFIRADGKKMSRVFENLINNAVKYSMKNTRVYLSAAEEGNKIAAEIKNISAYPLNFDVREITERFVRGDESRSAEGNGLGLAIAKSYTELCGGSFEIITDGDLFKARLLFDKN